MDDLHIFPYMDTYTCTSYMVDLHMHFHIWMIHTCIA